MKIIPVIDLKDGQVVHAREGKRDQYQALKTHLCQTSDIFDVIQALVTTYHFDTVYIADLNAITQQGHHRELIKTVLIHFSELLFWVDSGYLEPTTSAKFPENYLPVLGTESYRDDNLQEIRAFDNQFILSLDYASLESLGPDSLFLSSAFWPKNIIIMTLDRVGSQKGPDLAKLISFRTRYPDKNFIAAGGIRHYQDLLDLQEMGVEQALIASALHAETISADQITNIQAKKYPN
ncbi:MAG: nickel transporter [Methylococcaceae bacterium]|nr:nickel transporter [Methylococcaceae bacterium]